VLARGCGLQRGVSITATAPDQQRDPRLLRQESFFARRLAPRETYELAAQEKLYRLSTCPSEAQARAAYEQGHLF
jgi:hypothetical protein